MNIDIERIIEVALEKTEKMLLPYENMVLIPAGEFQMGSDKGDNNGNSARTVYVEAFYMDVYQVTVGQYKAFLRDTRYGEPDKVSNKFSPTDEHPVVYVSWHDAEKYAAWAGKRLPTEAEWEKAARGKLVGQNYPWDNVIDPNKANYVTARVGRTRPVGSYSPNGYGLYDMAGNVWEWCLDACENVTGERVLRGGSWGSPARNLRVYNRSSSTPVYGNAHRGFRCVRDVMP